MAFSLSDLKPTQEPFELEDGKIIYFRSKQDLDIQELAAYNRIHQTIINAGKMKEKAGTEDQYGRAAAKNDTACREMIALILPDLPSKVLESMSAGMVDRLAAWCINVASGMISGFTPDADDLEKVRQLHPDLPDEFVRTLTRRQVDALLPEMVEVEAKN